jgi:hypothetical protein
LYQQPPLVQNKQTVLSAETKSTEPSKRLLNYKLPVCGETSEISVISKLHLIVDYYFITAILDIAR